MNEAMRLRKTRINSGEQLLKTRFEINDMARAHAAEGDDVGRELLDELEGLVKDVSNAIGYQNEQHMADLTQQIRRMDEIN